LRSSVTPVFNVGNYVASELLTDLGSFICTAIIRNDAKIDLAAFFCGFESPLHGVFSVETWHDDGNFHKLVKLPAMLKKQPPFARPL